MKFLLLIAALATVAHAKFELYLDDKLVENEHLAKMDFKARATAIKTAEDVQELPKNVVDDLIIAQLEKLRENFETGWPEQGIPPVDPFAMEKATFTLNQPLIFSATININDILMTGLKDFIIEQIKFNILRLSFDFALVAPDTVYQSGFDVKGRIAVVQRFEFSGFARARMQGFLIGGTMSMGTTTDGFLTLKTFKLEMSVDDMKLYVSGVEGAGPLEDIFNWLMSNLTNEFLNESLASMAEQLSVAMFDSLNEVLGTINLNDLIG